MSLDLLEAMTIDEWAVELNDQLRYHGDYPFALVGPIKLFVQTHPPMDSPTYAPYIGEEVFDLKLVHPRKKKLIFELWESGYPREVRLDAEECYEAFGLPFKQFLETALREKEQRDHEEAEDLREKAQADADLYETLTIKKENPDWGSW